MKPVIHFCLLFYMAMLTFISCKKGDTGPAGTANVFYSDWFKPDAYIKDTIFGTWGFKYNKPAPGITQNIIDSGAVLVFGKLTGYNPVIWPANQVSQLPISLTYVSGGIQMDTWSAFASVGNLRIRFTNDHNIYTSIANTHQFRYVIIPGGMHIARLRTLSYQEIAGIYNLPE